MSVETWIEEFLPAHEPEDDREAVCMTIKHWIGMLPANMSRHSTVHGLELRRATRGHMKVVFEEGAGPCVCCNHIISSYRGCDTCPLNFGWENPDPDDMDDEGCTRQPEYIQGPEGDREPGIFRMLELWEEMKDEH